MNSERLKEIECLDGFLVSLSPECVDYKQMTEEQVIQNIVQRNNTIAIKQTIEEGRELLAMEPFPWEWVQSMSQSLVYDAEQKKWVEDPALYHAWLKNVLDMLEKEARSQGKLA